MKPIVVVKGGAAYLEKGEALILDLDNVDCLQCPYCNGELDQNLVCRDCKVDWDDTDEIRDFINHLEE
jgi:hypothetical protein